MSTNLTGAELLALEERHYYYFMTDIRPVGEEKGELYPEPQYFHIAIPTMVLMFEELQRRVLARTTTAEFGQSLKRPLSRCTALHVSGTSFLAPMGRQMWLDLLGTAHESSETVVEIGDLRLTDTDMVKTLRFWYEVGSNYREDGFPYPSRERGLGTDYRILTPSDAAAIAGNATGVDEQSRKDLVNLWATVRALSFLMEAETRDALMMHGPYPLGNGRSLVMFECNDLNWRLFPQFPLPGQRWEIPDKGFEAGDLAIGLVLRDVEVQADRMGTLYVTPWSADRVEAATLLTRGTDEWANDELKTLDIADAAEFARGCDEAQEMAFLQLAEWNMAQRMAGGHFQKMMFMLRVLAGAGADRAEITEFFDWSLGVTRNVWDRHFDQILNMKPEDMTFFNRMTSFVTGSSDHVFTPLRGSAGGA